MKRTYLSWKWFAMLCVTTFSLISFLFGGWLIGRDALSVQAETNGYLQVKSSDFTVETVSKPSTSLTITLKCEFNLPHSKDDYFAYGLEVDGKTLLLYNGKGEQLNVMSVSPGGASNLLSIMIQIKKGTTTLPAAKNLDTIVIPKGAKISSPNPSLGAGIEFVNGLTLIKVNGTWDVEQAQAEEKTYDVALNTASLAWSSDTSLLEALIPLPFSQETQISYVSAFSAEVNGVLGTANAVQYANEAQVRLQFEDYHELIDNEIPCVRMQGGTLTDAENKVLINLTGEVSFYEYVDGSWATERYVQVRERVLNTITERKLSATDTYEFVKPQTDLDKLCLGWSINGELIEIGERIEIESYTKRSLETEAVLVEYQSITGASIRYDEAGDSSGIRFGAKLFMEDFEKYGAYIQGVGMIVMPSDLIGTTEFTLENYGKQGEAKNFFVSTQNIATTSNHFTLYATIVKVLQSNYNREFCARAYLLTENGAYVWSSKIETRSVHEVATAVMEQHKQKNDLKTWQSTIIETYLNGVAEITYENGRTSVVSVALSPVIASAQATLNGDSVSLTLPTAKTSFACITYNGKRIKNATQTYQNGILTITFENFEEK